MKVFVTGASSWVGTAVTAELLAAGHTVVGLARSDASAEKLKAAGADVVRGDLSDTRLLAACAADADGVIHCGFIHDFSNFAASCATDAEAVRAMCTALEGTNKPFLTTSGLLGVPKPPGGLAVEATPTAPWFPRRSESALDWAAKGVRAVAVRLAPSVHGTGDHGFVPRLADIARDKGCAAYVGDGANCWPGVHVADAAALYRLALERAPAGAVVHACADEGVPMKEVAALIGRKLGLPVAPVEGEAAAAHFGWFERFAAMDGAASSAATRDLLGWAPKGPGLLEDIEANYF